MFIKLQHYSKSYNTIGAYFCKSDNTILVYDEIITNDKQAQYGLDMGAYK